MVWSIFGAYFFSTYEMTCTVCALGTILLCCIGELKTASMCYGKSSAAFFKQIHTLEYL